VSTTERPSRRLESDARYRSLIHGAAYGMYLTTIDGRILDVNPALARMLGYESVDDLRSRTMADVYEHLPDRAMVIGRTGEAEYGNAEVRWKRKDGTAVLVHLSARRVELADGTQAFEGIAEDVTERRALEDQLRRAQRMEAIARLARGVAHDFNNVLAAIIGSSDLLQYQLPAGSPARDEADEIRKAAERGASLTRRLLAFARNQMLEPQIIDLNAILTQQMNPLHRLAGDRITLRVRTPDTPTRVKVEPGQLEQVFLNLVANACDAMPNGGAIEIEVGPLALDDREAAQYHGIPAGDYARIVVSDTGSGIDPMVQPHVFEPFFTTKDPSKGMGLGLSIVYGVAKEAGGTVAFTTEPSKGTTFEVLLPRQDRL
jgi:PAS domain S-box-containing protein